MKTKQFTMTDHNRMLRACADSRATEEEKSFLGYMAGLAAACEPVSADDYRRASILAAINLHVEDSVFDRPRAELNLYLVNEGAVTQATAETECDGANSILVAATSEDGALKVADAYDRGLVTFDNLAWDGKTIAVVTLRDSDTGLYA